jgi:hypothetical protein
MTGNAPALAAKFKPRSRFEKVTLFFAVGEAPPSLEL